MGPPGAATLDSGRRFRGEARDRWKTASCSEFESLPYASSGNGRAPPVIQVCIYLRAGVPAPGCQSWVQCSARRATESTRCSGLPIVITPAHSTPMGTRSRESIYGASIRASAERAKQARKEADRLACGAWNKRMLGYKRPAQPSPALGDAVNAGYCYFEVVARPTRRSLSISFGDLRRRRSMSSSATCAVAIARNCEVILTSAVISSRCGLPRYRPTIRRRPGGRESARR
jgi:hypothetical protein